LFESLKKYFNVNKENKNYFYIFKRILCFEMFGNISIFRKKRKKKSRREKQNFYQTKTLLSGPYIKRPQSSESDKCNWASIGPLQRDVCVSLLLFVFHFFGAKLPHQSTDRSRPFPSKGLRRERWEEAMERARRTRASRCTTQSAGTRSPGRACALSCGQC
jgi:hypothetical protein